MATNQIKLVISATDNSSAALKNIANNINNLKKGVASLTNTSATTSSGVESVNTKISKTPGLLSRVASGAKNALAVFGGFKLISGIFNNISSGMSGAISRLDTMDLFERKMKIITGDANAAAYALEHMKTATKGTAYGLDTAAKAVQNFVTRGMSTKDATASIETWMDAVAVYGNGTNEALTSVVNALGKMRSKGTVEMRHINSMINAGINPVQLYAKATNQSAAEVQTQLSEKTLRTEEFLAVVENALRTGAGGVAKVTGMAKEMATTWQATFDNMRFAINRGWAAMIDGASELLTAFGGDGIKGIFKNFGVASENIMTAIGDSLKSGGATIKAFYEDFKKSHSDTINRNTQTLDQLRENISKFSQSAKESLRTNFLQALDPFSENIANTILNIQVNWNRFKEAVAKGVQQISPQLGQLFGKIFGQGITSATDLVNAFLQWATLKLPYFFDWVQQKLQWLIDHWEEVKTLAGYILKGFIAWKISSSVARDITKLGLAFLLLKNRLFEIKKIGTNLFNGMFGLDKVSATTIGEINPIVNTANPAKIAEMGSLTNVAESEAINIPVTGLQKAGLEIKNALGGIKGFFADSFSTSKSILGDFASYVTESFKTMLNGIKEFVLEGGSLLGDKFGGIFEGIKDVVIDFPTVTGKGLSNLGTEGFSLTGIEGFEGGFFTETLKGLVNFGSKTIEIFTTLIQKVTGFVGEFFRPILDGFLQLGGSSLDDFVANFLTKFGVVKDFAISTFNGIKEFIISAVINMKDIVTEFISTMFEGFSGLGGESILSGVEGFESMAVDIFPDFNANMFSEISAGIMGSASAVLSLVTSISSLAINIANVAAIIGMFNPGGAISNAINEFFDGFGDKAMSFGENAKKMIISMGQEFIKDLPQLVSQGVQLVVALVRGLFIGLPNILAAGVQIISGLVTSFLQQAPTLVYQGLHAIGEFIAGIISALPDIANAAWNLIKSLAAFIIENLPLVISTGIQIVWSIITGIGSMIGQVGQALWDLCAKAVDWIKNGGLQQVWQGFTDFIMDCIRSAFDNVGAGWLADKLFGEKEQEKVSEASSSLGRTAAEQNIQASQDFLAQKDITPNMVDSYTKGQEQLKAAAAETGTEAANSYLEGLTGTVDGADVDVDVLTDEAGTNVENATTAGSDVGTAYTTSAADALTAGSESVTAAANNISSQLNLTFDSGVVQQQATDFINTIAIVFTEQAPLLYQTTGNIGVGAVNEFIAKVNENLEPAYATAIGLMSFFRQGIDEGFNGVREAISLGVQTMLPILQQVTTTFYNDGQNSVMQYAHGFKDNAELAAIEALAFKTSVVEIIRGIPEAAYGIGRSTIEAFHNGTIDNEETVITDYTELAERIGSALETRLGTAFSSVANKVKEESYDMYLGVVQNLTPLDPYLNQLGNSLVRTASDKAKDVYDNVMKQISPLPGDMQTIGQQMMTNLRQGIEDKMQEVVDTTSTLVDALKETFKQGLGIHSPSRFMRWVGQMMLTGLIGGLSLEEIKKWTELIVGDMRSSFDKGTIDPFDTVDFLKDDTVALIGYLTGVDTSNAQASSGQLTWPIPGYQFHVNSPFGNRRSPGNGGSTNHQGVDLMSGHGNPIVAALPGTVSVSGRYFGYGNAVVLEHGNGIQTRYGHFLGTAVSVGQTVQAGQTVGFSDSTGNSTGDHLHFEIRQNGTPVDPVPYLQGAAMSGVMIDPLANVLQTVYSMYQNSIDKLHWRDGMEGLGDVPIMAGAMGANMSTAGSGLIEPDWFKSWTPPAAVSRWTPQVLQALSILGEPASLLKGVLWAINGESGGNPNDINLWDSNAAIGDPTKGLLQIMMANFKPLSQGGWGVEGYTHNIWDPLENILTGLGEMKWKPIYASRGGIAGVINRRLAEGKWSGYAVGTRYVPQDMLAPIHEGEAILPASMNPYTKSGGDYLKDLVSTIFYTDDGLRMDTEGVQAGVVNNNQTINIEAPINVTVEASEGAEQIGNDIAEEIHKALTRAMMVGNAR